MSPLMYDAAVPPLQRALGQLIVILEKGQAHAEAEGFESSILVDCRLFPDMFPLSRQVQIASDIARRGIARLAGVEAPSMEDIEKNLPELIQRVQRSLEYLKEFTPEQFADSADRDITVPIGGGQTITMMGWPFLSGFVMPNVYFHVTTAYNILRHNGVPLGKRDYLGEP